MKIAAQERSVAFTFPSMPEIFHGTIMTRPGARTRATPRARRRLGRRARHDPLDQGHPGQLRFPRRQRIHRLPDQLRRERRPDHGALGPRLLHRSGPPGRHRPVRATEKNRPPRDSSCRARVSGSSGFARRAPGRFGVSSNRGPSTGPGSRSASSSRCRTGPSCAARVWWFACDFVRTMRGTSSSTSTRSPRRPPAAWRRADSRSRCDKPPPRPRPPPRAGARREPCRAEPQHAPLRPVPEGRRGRRDRVGHRQHSARGGQHGRPRGDAGHGRRRADRGPGHRGAGLPHRGRDRAHRRPDHRPDRPSGRPVRRVPRHHRRHPARTRGPNRPPLRAARGHLLPGPPARAHRRHAGRRRGAGIRRSGHRRPRRGRLHGGHRGPHGRRRRLPHWSGVHGPPELRRPQPVHAGPRSHGGRARRGRAARARVRRAERGVRAPRPRGPASVPRPRRPTPERRPTLSGLSRAATGGRRPTPTAPHGRR